MRVAARSTGNQRHGAVLVRGGSLLATGINRHTNSPKIMGPEFLKTKCSVHAEIAALRQVRSAVGAVIYVARINPAGMPVLSAPCPACAAALSEAGVRRVIHT